MRKQKGNLAIASVPIQEWGELYSADEAIKTGTIFRDLDLPFFAADSIPDREPGGRSTDLLGSPEEQKCQADLLEIQKVSFVLDDLRLYLDTHPEDADGLALLKDLLQKRRMLKEDFAQACYPLTPDCMGTVYLQNPDSSCFCWQEGPAPWEGDCCCMAGQDNDRRQTDPALRKGGCA